MMVTPHLRKQLTEERIVRFRLVAADYQCDPSISEVRLGGSGRLGLCNESSHFSQPLLLGRSARVTLTCHLPPQSGAVVTP